MLIKLQNCTPEFLRRCFPDQSGNVFVDNYRALLFIVNNSIYFRLEPEMDFPFIHLHEKYENQVWNHFGLLLHRWIEFEQKKEWFGGGLSTTKHQFYFVYDSLEERSALVRYHKTIFMGYSNKPYKQKWEPSKKYVSKNFFDRIWSVKDDPIKLTALLK